MEFDGFRPQTLDFLVENRIQNSREWFEAHRAVYNDYVLTPLRELVTALTPTLLEIDPEFTVTPAVNKTISRIYRDTRFSRDKSLYRDVMWITFMRRKKFWEGLPGYYFVFGPDGMEMGVGYYEATPAAMDCFRQMVLRSEPAFRRMRAAYNRQKEFTVHAERYKRTRFPDEPESARFWLDMRNIDFESRSTDFDLLFSPRLAGELARMFLNLKPMYEFICAVEARRQHEASAQ